MLHAAFVRSHHAHARLLGVDTTAALRAPGVVAVFTDAELRELADDIQPSQMANLIAPAYPALARGIVRMVGEPVAMVVAETRYHAEDGAELVSVDYEPLPAVVDMYAALGPGAPLVFEEAGTNLLHHSVTTYGDPGAAFATAAHVVTAVFRQHRHANVPMEGHGGAALYDPASGELEYHASHQNPHALRVWLTRLLHHTANRVRVRCGDIGGAFGQKGHLGREDVAVCAAALALGRPVKWVEDRAENLVAGGQAREEDLHVRAAVDDDGVVGALDVHMVLDQGSYPMCGFASVGYTNLVRALVPAAYRVEHLRFEASVVATNKATYVPYRGPWEAETWLRERMLDVVARAVGLDPVEVRARNLRDEFPARMCTGPELIGITQRQTMASAVALVDYDGWRAKARARAGAGTGALPGQAAAPSPRESGRYPGHRGGQLRRAGAARTERGGGDVGHRRASHRPAGTGAVGAGRVGHRVHQPAAARPGARDHAGPAGRRRARRRPWARYRRARRHQRDPVQHGRDRRQPGGDVGDGRGRRRRR